MKRICVLGVGISGFEAARLALSEGGFEVWLTDDYPERVRDRVEKLLSFDRVRFFEVPEVEVSKLDLLVVSPGVPKSHPLVRSAVERGIPVWGDVEFAYRFVEFEAPKKFLVVTGTNGKTTTTGMLSHMLAKEGFSVFTGGNYGVPLSVYVREHKEVDFVVLELSSFQIGYMDRFTARGGAFLNVAEDHVDVHGGFEEYVNAKLSLSGRLLEFRVVNGDDVLLKERLGEGSYLFSCKQEGFCSVKDGYIVVDGRRLFSVSALSERERLNLPNIMASLCMAVLVGVDPERALSHLRDFRYPRFRMEFVGEFAGVKVFNDSKATNPHAVLKALEGFKEKSVVLIMGGQNKGMNFSCLKNEVASKVSTLVLYGDVADELKGEFVGTCEVVAERDFREAVRKACLVCREGDVLLLSPGCASFDQFSSYVERGERFNQLVKEFLCAG